MTDGISGYLVAILALFDFLRFSETYAYSEFCTTDSSSFYLVVESYQPLNAAAVIHIILIFSIFIRVLVFSDKTALFCAFRFI